MKQPFQLTNFSPFSTVTSWTRRKCVRIIIKSDYFSTFYAFVATFSGFFTCSVHKLKFKKLKTRLISNLDIKTLLATFLSRTDFHFLSDSSSRSSCSFSRWNKLSSSGISYSCRRFTHVLSIYQLKLCSQLKGLKAYPIKSYHFSDDLLGYSLVANCLSGQFHLLIEVCYGQFPNPFRNFCHKMVYTLYYRTYLYGINRGLSLEPFGLYPRPPFSFLDTT